MIEFKVKIDITLLKQIQGAPYFWYIGIQLTLKIHLYTKTWNPKRHWNRVEINNRISLQASYGGYFNESMYKMNNNEFELQNLMKNEISLSTSAVINNCNVVIQEQKINEVTFNKNVEISIKLDWLKTVRWIFIV